MEELLKTNILSESDEAHILQSIEIAKSNLKWNEERLPELMGFYETLPEEEVDIDYDYEEDDDDDDGATSIYLSFKAVLLSILFLSFINKKLFYSYWSD